MQTPRAGSERAVLSALGAVNSSDAAQMTELPESSQPADGVTTWRQWRVPHAAILMLACCVVAFGVTLYKTRHLDFYYDEWSFLNTAAHWHLHDYFVPHNEHWSTIPMLIYKVLLTVNGAHSYLPFLAVLLLLHVSVGFLLFLIVRRRSGDLLGLLAGGTMLFLGRGAEDFIWAFQIGFTGSVAYGLFAIYLLDSPRVDRKRAALASFALLLSLMSSGIGLFFVVATAAHLVVDRSRRSFLWTLIVPGLAYAWWYEAFGAKAVAGDPSPLSLAALKGVIGYAPSGIGSATAGVFALPTLWSPLAFAALTTTVVLLWYRKRADCGLAVAAAVAITAQFTLTGLVRSQLGDGQSSASRYIYVGGVFVLLILAEAVRDLPWRGVWRAALPVTALCTIAGGAWVLNTTERNRVELVQGQRPVLQITWLFRAAPGLDRNVIVNKRLLPVVTPALYEASRSQYGSTLPAISVADLAKLNRTVVNTQMRILMPLRVTTTADARVGACLTTVAVGGHVDLRVPGGSQITVYATHAGDASRVTLNAWYLGSNPPAGGSLPESVPAGEGLRAGVPDTGLGLSWQLRVAAVSGSAVSVCGNNG